MLLTNGRPRSPFLWANKRARLHWKLIYRATFWATTAVDNASSVRTICGQWKENATVCGHLTTASSSHIDDKHTILFWILWRAHELQMSLLSGAIGELTRLTYRTIGSIDGPMTPALAPSASAPLKHNGCLLKAIWPPYRVPSIATPYLNWNFATLPQEYEY